MYEEEEIIEGDDGFTPNKVNRFNDAFGGDDENDSDEPLTDDELIDDDSPYGFRADKDPESESVAGEID